MSRFRFRRPGQPRERLYRAASGLLVPRGFVSISKQSRRERGANRRARARAAAALERDLADVIASFREGISIREAEIAAFAGDARIIVNAAAPNELETQLVAVLGENLERALRSGVEIGLRFAPPALAGVPVSLATEAAALWAEQKAATLAVGLTEATQNGIREILSLGLRDQISTTEMARRIGNIAGLRPDQVRAVEKFRAQITEQLVPIEEALTPQVQRVIDQQVARYRDRQLLLRGRTIAETETQSAITAGERAFWDHAIAQGSVEGENVVKTWRTVHDSHVCPICEPLHGQTVPYDAPFMSARGALQGPGAHPRCRCYIEYAEREQPSRRPDRGTRAIREQENRRFLDPGALREDIAAAQQRLVRLEGRLSRLPERSGAARRLRDQIGIQRVTIGSLQEALTALAA